MKKLFTNKIFLTAIGILLFIAFWYVIYYVARGDSTIFPSPHETFIEAFSYLGEEFTYKCIWGSLQRMLIGFLIASVAGILLGVIVGNYTSLKYVFNPTMIALKAVPTAALVFLFLVIAGLKNAPIYVVVIIVFPMVYEATVSGYRHIDENILMALKVESRSNLMANIRVKFPLSFPYISLGLISSFALSFKIEIMAEVISGSSSYGIGRAISTSYSSGINGMIPTFAYSLIAIMVMLLVSLVAAIIKHVFKLKDLNLD